MTMNKPPAWTRPRTPLLFGAGAITACLAVDSVALAVGTAVAGTAVIILKPLAAVLLAIGAILAVMIGARRRGQIGASCSTTGLCATIARRWYRLMNPTRAEAVGCALDRAHLARVDAFRSIFREALEQCDATAERVVWRFTWSPAIESKVRALAAVELPCCPFTTAGIRRRDDEFYWDLIAPPRARATLALLDDLAEEAMASRSRP